MFDKLRRELTVYNTIIFGLLTLILVSAVFVVSYFRTSVVINNGVETANNMVRVTNLPSTIWQSTKREPNCLVLFLNMNNLRIEYTSDKDMYSDEVINDVIVFMSDNKKVQGRKKIDKVYFAFKVDPYISGEITYLKIALYDYTEQRNSLIYLATVLGSAFLFSLGVLFLLFKRYAKRTVEPIEDAFIKQRDLVANASHELKTPLTIISTNLSLLKEENNPENNKKWSDSIAHQLKRMANLVNDMLELAKVENEESVTLKRVNASDMLQGILLSMEASFFENNQQLSSEIVSGLVVKAQPDNLEKLFYTLLENAVKYTPKGGNISVKLFLQKKRIMFKLKNTGEGIEEEQLSKLFDRFYKRDASHNSGGGTGSFGLGLAIAKSIVDGIGGEIYADSKLGEYTEFTVIFNK